MRKLSTSIDGHFGEWLQGRLGTHGPIVLVTLPCPRTGVVARRHSREGSLRVVGAGLDTRPGRALVARFEAALKSQPRHAIGINRDINRRPSIASETPQSFDCVGSALNTTTPHPGIVVRHSRAWQGRIRVLPRNKAGLGTGVSTAALVALARLGGWRGPLASLARACVAAEGASDPIMFPIPERLLWASREGRAVATLPTPPAHEVLGGFFGGARPTDPTDTVFPDISDLVDRWRCTRDLAAFAALASESARRSLALRAAPGACIHDPTAALAAELGALGWAMAHTGAARALIFAPGRVPPGAAETLRAAGLRGILRFRGGRE